MNLDKIAVVLVMLLAAFVVVLASLVGIRLIAGG